MKKFGGTGLGLYITKQLITKMKGTIVIHSLKDTGSDVIVVIPVEVASNELCPQSNSSKSQPTIPEPLKEHHVLVVEDETYHQFIIKMYLEKLGIAPVIVKNGVEACKAFEEMNESYFSLLIMDIYKPYLDGLSALETIRDIEEKRKSPVAIPIIIISSSIIDADKFVVMNPVGKIQATAFLAKPVRVSHFNSCVIGAIKKKNKANKPNLLLPSFKVLVVDDDSFNLNVAVSHFAKFSIACDTANNGSEAVKMIINGGLSKYTAVVMDSEMPIMDGITATKEIKRFCNAVNKDIKVIALSGREDSEFKMKCKEAGINSIYTKPANYRKIINEIVGLTL